LNWPGSRENHKIADPDSGKIPDLQADRGSNCGKDDLPEGVGANNACRRDEQQYRPHGRYQDQDIETLP
jgi:hypothetical protein